MLQAQSLPDTGWPTYRLSPLFLFHTAPPIKTTTIHCRSNPRPPPSPSPRSFSPSYLRELGVNQSFVGPCMLLQPALLHGHGDYLVSAGGHGVAKGGGGGVAFWRGWGRGYHVARPGIQSDAGLSSGGRFSDKVTAKRPGLFSPLPLSLSVHLTSLTSHSVLSSNTRSFGSRLSC